MIPALRARRTCRVIWRAHIGLDLPNDRARDAWRVPASRTSRRPTATCSRARRSRGTGSTAARVTVIPPSIDAFAPKNQVMSFTSVTGDPARRRARAQPRATRTAPCSSAWTAAWASCAHRADMLEEAPLPADAPLLAQVSRWDRLKDPLGVLAAFAEHVHAAEDPHLLLAGPDVRRWRTTRRAPRSSRRSKPPGTSLPRRSRRARPSRGAADGRRRGERGDRQRAAAPRRRRGPEEPRRGLRADRGRGDVEGAAGRRHHGRRHPGPDRGRRAPGTSSRRATSKRSASG